VRRRPKRYWQVQDVDRAKFFGTYGGLTWPTDPVAFATSIEFGMVKFDYLPDGRIAGLGDIFISFTQAKLYGRINRFRILHGRLLTPSSEAHVGRFPPRLPGCFLATDFFCQGLLSRGSQGDAGCMGFLGNVLDCTESSSIVSSIQANWLLEKSI
jgi:hypothetical protein